MSWKKFLAEEGLDLADDALEGILRSFRGVKRTATTERAVKRAAKVAAKGDSAAMRRVLATPVEGASKRAAAKPRKALPKQQAPAVVRDRSGTPRDKAAAILEEAARPGKKLTYADWRAGDPDLGVMFDLSKLDNVPDVPQVQMPRYEPPRGTSPRMERVLARDDVRQGLNAIVEKGADAGGLGWYNTEPLRQRMAEVMPADEVTPRYGRMMDLIAATSPRSKVPDNVRTGSYYNYLSENSLPISDKPAKGYGSVAQKLHAGNARGIADIGGWDVFKNPKPASFSTNLQGNQQNVTIDTHNMRLPGILSRDEDFLTTSIVPEKGAEPIRPRELLAVRGVTMDDLAADPVMWDTKPRPNEYGYYEKWQQDQARDMGISPAQYQASMWLGGGDDTGLGSAAEPFLQTFEARVLYTAERMGMDPEDVLNLAVRGDIPLLAKGGRVEKKAGR